LGKSKNKVLSMLESSSIFALEVDHKDPSSGAFALATKDTLSLQ